MFSEQSLRSTMEVKTLRKNLSLKRVSQCGKNWQPYAMWVPNTHTHTHKQERVYKTFKMVKPERHTNYSVPGDQRSGFQGSKENDSDHPWDAGEWWKSVHSPQKCKSLLGKKPTNKVHITGHEVSWEKNISAEVTFKFISGAWDSTHPPFKWKHRQTGHFGKQIPQLEWTESVIRVELSRTCNSSLCEKLPDHSPRQW